MKNIYILPTDSPSKLALQLNNQPNYNLQFSEQISTWTFNWEKQNIYITDNSEIKEENWVYCIKRKLFGKIVEIQLAKNTLDNSMLYFEIEDKEIWCKLSNCKKIILTTDQYLIKNGVQAIDDVFLEWFVENLSCEEVEVESKLTKDGVWTDLNGYVELPTIHSINYKIIIPKEDSPVSFNINYNSERSYSEEEVLKIIQDCKSYLSFGDEFDEIEWFNKRFKKK